jgi:DNA-binding transcriptional ArsR family regulator
MPRDSVLSSARFDLTSFGELVSDPSRVALLLALMDGSACPATELASIAGVPRSTASSHLQRLVAGQLLRVEAMGRHRYFRLASDEVADALEAVALLQPARRATSPVRDPARLALVDARTCYRHLAGRLGVAWLGALEAGRFVGVSGGAIALTRRGERWLTSVSEAPPSWPSGKPCLDWTERRYHLGGPLGGLLTEQLFALEWLARRGDGRAVGVTAKGESELARCFALRTLSG